MSAAVRDSTVAEGLIDALGVTVSISDGATTTNDVPAVVNSTVPWPAEGAAAADLYERREFDIAVSAYTLAGLAVEPAEGHVIHDGNAWTVAIPPVSDEPRPWRFINQARTVYRIQAWRGMPQ